MTPHKPILVVDDNLDFADSMADILEGRGYRCTTAGGGEEALGLLQKQDFGLVLMDVLMPGMNGVMVYKQLRAAGFSMPVVLITAYSEMELLGEALEAGVAAILHKPMDPSRILAIVANNCQHGNSLLLVDDDLDFLHTMGEAMENGGYSVTTAETGDHALKCLKKQDYQLILLDLRLKGEIQGIDIYHYLREKGDQTPVCFVTGYMEEQMKLANALDCEQVLRKPFSPEKLLAKISSLIRPV
ncbi:MAG: response regulator [Deltaproteobacteria bacterium]|nr:response regulator [Deltaproteobacteria bacterium]